MELVREITVDADADEVRRLLTDAEELAAWVGDEVRLADVRVGRTGVAWTWSPDGVESTVEVTIAESDAGTTVRVVERRATGARASCSIGDAWDDRLLGLELRCLGLRRAPIPA